MATQSNNTVAPKQYVSKKLSVDGSVDSVAVSVLNLKSSNVDDELLFIRMDGTLELFTVTDRVSTRGRNGGVALTLRNFITEETLKVDDTSVLPLGVSIIRKVIAGVNERTRLRGVSQAKEHEVKAILTNQDPAEKLTKKQKEEKEETLNVLNELFQQVVTLPADSQVK